ncbi:MAG: sigma-54-dependent Fis family transcriptional regulator [Ignavibacteriaceae bacterium]|nr:sigma-54-dependent Fis family transcriptional regulator [Ignavibacteriaceae bacterium]
MISWTETQQQFQKKLGDTLSKLSTSFMDLNTDLKTTGASPEVLKKVEKIFKQLMESNQSLTSEMNKLWDHLQKLETNFEQLKEEKRKLEVLYSSGILFTSETEMKALMEIAINTVVKELKADAGFIILANEKGETDSVFAKNMKPDESPEAMEMSTTVIRNTINASAPQQFTPGAIDERASSESIIRLGISAVLCVPLTSGSKVLGAVYIDRRNKENAFRDYDLVFLLSFAKQIVRGLEISLEISSLERKLLSEAIIKFEDLRNEFKCDKIIGNSKKLFEVLKIAAKISATEASVVLLGENGTGKDLVARAIHENSQRANHPFITIDCGSIPADLLESEFFGYESGAFTGATKQKPGKLEMADGGTLFFDEIGEMSTNLQAKLLRVLQTREFERLGSVQTRKIDVRVICATNRNIGEMIAQGRFREDLYYRLKVIELTMPPLRERKEDTKELCEYFLTKHAREKTFSITEEALEVLEEYNWPGNIRELENVILRCVVLAKNSQIDKNDLPPELLQKVSEEPIIKAGKTLLDAETEFRRMYIIRTLRKTNSKSEAAQILGINRTHFYKLLSQLDIES